MAAPYYTHSSGKPANQTRALAGEMRDELDQIAASFNLLPIPSAIVAGISNYAVDTGIANAYVISINPSTLTAYTDGMTLRFRATNANTGAATINVNGLGLKTLVRPDGTALLSGDIYAGQICQISYSTTSGAFQLSITTMNAAYQSAASAAAAAISQSSASSSAASATLSAAAALASETLAQKWAVSLTLVDGTYYGSRKYSIDANTSAINANASAAAAQASSVQAEIYATQQMNATSTTSHSLTTGSKTFTVETNKGFVINQYLVITPTADSSKFMQGSISSYDKVTGALIVNVDYSSSTGGPYTAWTLGVIGRTGTGAIRPTVIINANTTAINDRDYVFSGICVLTMPDPASVTGAIGLCNGTTASGPQIDFGAYKVKGFTPGLITMDSATNATVVKNSGSTSIGYSEI